MLINHRLLLTLITLPRKVKEKADKKSARAAACASPGPRIVRDHPDVKIVEELFLHLGRGSLHE